MAGKITLSDCSITALADAIVAAQSSVTVDVGTGWDALFDGLSADLVAAIEASTTAITADLQAICDKLDAGIDVNATQAGTWTVAIDGDVGLSADAIADLAAALEGLDVTIAGQDVTLDVNITNTGAIEVALDAASLAALENITVTVDTSAGPVEVTGDVTIDGEVAVSWDGLADALTGLDVSVDNFADLAALLDGLEVSFADGQTFPLPDTQLNALVNVAIQEGDQTQALLEQLIKRPEIKEVCLSDGCTGYAALDLSSGSPVVTGVFDETFAPTTETIVACCDCGGATTQADAFPIDPANQVDNTKYNLDDPGFTNAYGDVGINNWTAADLAAALNADAASAPAPYTTTVWGSGTSAGGVDYVYVVSGPVPTSLDLVSVPISIPVSTI